NDPTVGCADCHIPPFYTDSRLELPFIKHDVGTADSADTDAAAGLDTPSLIGAWDTGPYLHTHFALTLTDVLTTHNPGDQHGTTSHLTGTEIAQLVEFVNSIAWPESTGVPVDAPLVAAVSEGRGLDSVYPNPFAKDTSLRFSLESRAERVRIDIHDVSGRLVRTLVERPLPRGTHTVGWDSRDASGSRVTPGVYFARLLVNGRQDGEKKMTVMR
ncbi:MAG TPA: FlgD immunoglobulin-like domain containing protein, partial [bacterium]|nr:FlgD immunoglobulin-like domain containing protein [bacterium]